MGLKKASRNLFLHIHLFERKHLGIFLPTFPNATRQQKQYPYYAIHSDNILDYLEAILLFLY